MPLNLKQFYLPYYFKVKVTEIVIFLVVILTIFVYQFLYFSYVQIISLEI